ncbi:MAG: DUF937 domain-containing protein [Gemmatimonadaceae bacterium]|nr:DUF937 domain-containing protein [Gemmatimonadaceae bacterium]MBA3645891.1 DUF937 domain-containing protein [Gemmatimonadaceae bacterium]
MSSIFDTIQQQLGGNAAAQIGQQLGLDPNMTQLAVNAAIPAILGGMAAHAAHQKGADEIHSEADNHTTPAPASTPADDNHSTRTGALGNVPNIFTGRGDAGGLLGKMVGHRTQAVQAGVAQASGIDKEKAGGLIGMLAPVVMGALAQQKQGGGLNAGNIGSILAEAQSQAHTQATQQSPGLGGVLGSVLSRIQTS